MKKIIKLTEHDLTRIVRRVLEEDLDVAPFNLKVVGGNIKVTNSDTKESYIYRLKAYIAFGVKDFVKVNSLNDDQLELSYGPVTKTKEVKKDKLKSLLKNNFGASKITYKTPEGEEVEFIKK